MENSINDKYNLNKEETIYIGDSPSDQKAANNANVKFGFAAWENKNEISDYDYKFYSPEDIYELVK